MSEELPTPAGEATFSYHEGWSVFWSHEPPCNAPCDLYTAEQVRGLILAERERCAEVCERLGTLKSASAEECAAAIRKD